MPDIVTILGELALSYGYFGVFAASLVGSVIPFVPVPYLFVVVLLSGRLDPLMLGVAAGFGGALGKTTSYLLGRWGYSIAGSGTRRNLEFLGKFVGRYGDLGVFVFAVTPLPDDIYMIPIGMLRFPFWRFIIANTLGKVVLSTAVAYFGYAFLHAAGLYAGADSLTSVAALIILTIAVTFLLARADWEIAYRRYKSDGIPGVISGIREILRLRRSPERETP